MIGNRDAALRAVLQRNDRYVHGLVEDHGICPFARPCRQQGRLWRSVCWITDGDVARLLDCADRLESVAQTVEVALLLLPGLASMTAQQLDRLHQPFRDRYNRREGGPTFYVVPFHPDYELNADSAGTLVRYWRKSPDPTLQFVHIETLEALRRADPREEHSRVALRLLAAGGTPEDVLVALQASPARASTSQRVADQNMQRFERLGQEPFDRAIAFARDVEAGELRSDWVDSAWAAAV